MPSSSKMMLTLAALLTATYALPMPQGAGTGAASNSLLSSTDNGVGYGVENAEDNTAATISGVKGAAPAAPAVPRSPQGAGTGAAMDSILSSTDDGVGHGIENAEDNTAGNIAAVKGAVPAARRSPQGAGTGAASNSLLSSTDNGVGYGVENAEDNTANLISGSKGTASSTGGSSSAPPPPPPPHARRQLDKIANGAQAVSNAAGTGAVTSSTTAALDNVDGETTGGQANAGAAAGALEVSTLEAAGNAIPKRQLDKISNGAQAISNAAGTGAATSQTTTGLDNIDGASTSGQAGIGAAAGDAEASNLEAVGSAIPKRQLDKISNGAQAISNAAGTGAATSQTTTGLDNIDGASTSGQAGIGAAVGSAEASNLEAAGSAVPKRQVN